LVKIDTDGLPEIQPFCIWQISFLTRFSSPCWFFWS